VLRVCSGVFCMNTKTREAIPRNMRVRLQIIALTTDRPLGMVEYPPLDIHRHRPCIGRLEKTNHTAQEVPNFADVSRAIRSLNRTGPRGFIGGLSVEDLLNFVIQPRIIFMCQQCAH